MEIVKTICHMCGEAYTGCGMNAYVENGKLVRVEGMKEHPTNRGGLCPKAFAAIQLEYDPNRLKYPLKRVGERGEGKWKRISWDEALDTIAAKLKDVKEKYGVKAVVWMKGQGGGWGASWELCQRFMSAFGSPNLSPHGHNCHIARGIGHLFTYSWMPDPDYENTRLIMLFGYNPVNTSLPNHFVRIMQAKERGVKLIVVDPRFTKTAAKADMFVQPRPGTDGALALGMIHVIIKENLYDKEFVDKWCYGFDKLADFIKDYPPEKVAEITWVPADTIYEIARMYATTKPAVLHESNGIDHHTNVVQTTRVLSILRAITGNLDVPGGNVLDPEIPWWPRTANLSMRKTMPEDLEKAYKESIAKHPLFYNAHWVPMPDTIDALLTGKPYPLRAMVVTGSDPVVILSDTGRTKEALKKLEFIAVHDIFMSGTAELADIVLPASTFLEGTMLIKYNWGSKHNVDSVYYALRNKVVEPLGESKPDAEFIFALAEKMGLEEAFPWKTVEESIDYELAPIGITSRDLKEHPESVVKKKYLPEELYRKYEKCLQILPTGKVELYSTVFESLGYDPLPTYKEPMESPISKPDLAKEYPLVCMAGLKPGLYTHTQYRTLPWLKEIMPNPWIEIHPDKAEELDIEEGDMVFVETPRGSIKLEAKVTEATDPRVVQVTHGWGEPYAHGPITNIITPDEDQLCPISAATGNRSFLCRVRKA